jgi:hypothetical protein
MERIKIFGEQVRTATENLPPFRQIRERMITHRERIIDEPDYLTPFEAHEHAEEIGTYLTEKDSLIYTIGVKGRIGAGHAIQAEDAYQFYKGLNTYDGTNIDVRKFNMEIHDKDIITQGYAWLQANPEAYKKFIEYFYNNAPGPVLDQVVWGWCDPKTLQEKMYGTGDKLHRKQNRTFITTHAKAAISVVKAIEDGILDPKHTLLFEEIPDPWNAQELLSMSSPIVTPNHYRVVHDTPTAHELIRGGRHPGKHIVPWGTVSNPFFLFNEITRDPDEGIHFGIELSGNDIPGVTEKIKAALRGGKELLLQDNVALTIHTMHHPQAFREIKFVLEEIGLANHPSIRLIGGENIPLEEAIFTRGSYKTGKPIHGYPRFGIPNIYIAKGGEVPLEDRGQAAVVYAIWGEKHEEKDIMVGLAAGRAVDFRFKEPGTILKDAKDDFESNQMAKRRRQSHAHLAPLVHIFPERYDKR